MDSNLDHKMSRSKSKCWYSNNCLHFFECAVPLGHFYFCHTAQGGQGKNNGDCRMTLSLALSR